MSHLCASNVWTVFSFLCTSTLGGPTISPCSICWSLEPQKNAENFFLQDFHLCVVMISPLIKTLLYWVQFSWTPYFVEGNFPFGFFWIDWKTLWTQQQAFTMQLVWIQTWNCKLPVSLPQSIHKKWIYCSTKQHQNHLFALSLRALSLRQTL